MHCNFSLNAFYWEIKFLSEFFYYYYKQKSPSFILFFLYQDNHLFRIEEKNVTKACKYAFIPHRAEQVVEMRILLSLVPYLFPSHADILMPFNYVEAAQFQLNCSRHVFSSPSLHSFIVYFIYCSSRIFSLL